MGEDVVEMGLALTGKFGWPCCCMRSEYILVATRIIRTNRPEGLRVPFEDLENLKKN